ncbi:von Willebrand factor type A domain protein [uncultured archaeon]|nr:von Willebrand factor type A domain protein [uncultured archaeon]
MSKENSPLSRMLTESYSVDTTSSLKAAASCKAVVLDDVSASELSGEDAAILGDYVANGGGLIVVGGAHAYRDYGNLPVFEQLLPVKAGGTPFPRKNTGVVLLVDISGSTGELSGVDPKLGIEKGLALQILKDLNPDDFLGIIAFNNAPHTVVSFGRYPDKSGVEDSVSRLRYGGTTHLAPALAEARNMIKDFEGGKNVIVISDGIVADSESSLAAAHSMESEGITLNAVGVGGDTDEDFMKTLAAAGGGEYLRRDQAHGIGLLSGETKTEKRTDGYPLLIINSGHFITRDLTLNATVYGYNSVFAKKNAQALLMTSNGNPVVSTWRFGLGRVVSLTVDNGNAWAPELYRNENSKIITSMTNYAIGDPSQGFEIQAQDGEIGKPIQVDVYSDRDPDLTFDGQRIPFARTGERLYSAGLNLNSTGFHDLSGYTIAVNVPSEYRELGNNELLDQLIRAGGGQVYNQSGIALLIPDIRNRNTGIVQETVDLGPLFLFAALLLYSIEVILRRISEFWH